MKKVIIAISLSIFALTATNTELSAQTKGKAKAKTQVNIESHFKQKLKYFHKNAEYSYTYVFNPDGTYEFTNVTLADNTVDKSTGTWEIYKDKKAIICFSNEGEGVLAYKLTGKDLVWIDESFQPILDDNGKKEIYKIIK